MESKNITQLELSKASGIAQSTISDWKRKKTNPSANQLLKICDVLNCDVYEILIHKDEILN